MTPSPGWVSIPKSFVSFFVFYILSYLVLKRMDCLLGAWCPLPVFKSCFVEIAQYSNDPLKNLWGKKLASLSYSSAILGLPLPPVPQFLFLWEHAYFFLHFWRISSQGVEFYIDSCFFVFCFFSLSLFSLFLNILPHSFLVGMVLEKLHIIIYFF